MNTLKTKFPFFWMISATAVTAATLSGCIWFINESHRNYSTALHISEDIGHVFEVLAHETEILFTAAQLGIFTDHLSWENRYYDASVALEENIAKIVEKYPESIDLGEITNLQHTLTAQIQLDNEAFDLDRLGDSDSAKKIIFSLSYEKNRHALATEISGLRKKLGSVIQSQHESAINLSSYASLLLTILFPLLCGVWFAVLIILNRWKSDVTRLNQDLNARVVARTQELDLQRQHSIEASKMASLGTMAGGIAHEINTPLAIIMGRVEMIKNQFKAIPDIPATAFDGLDKITKTASRIANIVRGLQMVSRNRDDDQFVPASLGTIINVSFDLCREKLAHHQIELRKVPFDDCTIECRESQICQVLVNLIGNAVDAIGSQSEKWIEISVIDHGDAVNLQFTDAGPGIPGEVAQKLMQPFFTTKPLGKGTGLGLSISKGMIESHRGELKLDRTCSNTRFVITLPKLHQVPARKII